MHQMDGMCSQQAVVDDPRVGIHTGHASNGDTVPLARACRTGMLHCDPASPVWRLPVDSESR